MRPDPFLFSALTIALVLPACSSTGSSPAFSGLSSPTAATRQAVEIQITVLHPAAKCPEPLYACVDISAGGSGPYVKWSACNAEQCSSQYDLVPHDVLVSRKSGLKAKDLRSTWSPKTGNPTEQQITETKPIKASKEPQFDDITYACYVHQPKTCSIDYEIGLIPK